MFLAHLTGLLLAALARLITGAHEITSRGSLDAAIQATCPILLAALGGLWAERAGVVNIGLEGQMILGTWGAAYFTYWYGPVQGIVGAILLGAIGGLIHAIATVGFGVDHIVSGVAINLIGLGLASFLAAHLAYAALFLGQGGGIAHLPDESWRIGVAAAITVAAVVAMALVWRRVRPALGLPMLACAVSTVAMGTAALSLDRPWLVIGAGLLLASHALFATERFLLSAVSPRRAE